MRDVTTSRITAPRAGPGSAGPEESGLLDAAGPGAAPRRPEEPAAPPLDAALTRIARAIAGRGSTAEVAHVVVDEVRRLLPAERATVAIWLPELDAFQVLATASGGGQPMLAVGDTVPVGEDQLRAVLQHQRPLREADLRQANFPIADRLAAFGLRSLLVVPVVADGTPSGFLAMASRQADLYTAAHEQVLSQLAVHLAVGLEQARLSAETRLHQARLLGLQRVGQRLAAIVAGEDALDIVLDEAVRSVGGDSGTLLAWDGERGVLVPLRNTVSTAAEFTVLRPGDGVAGRAIQQMDVVVLHDYQRDAGDETPAGRAGVRAAIGAPLILDGRLLGAVAANTADPAKRFDDADMQIFELYAGQAAAAMAAVRRFETERRQRRGAEEAARAAAAVVSEMDLQRRLDLIVERAVTIVGGDAGRLLLTAAGTDALTVRASFGAPPDQRRSGRAADEGDDPVARRVVAERRAVLDGRSRADGASGGRSVAAARGPVPDPPAVLSIGAPVMARGELLGALVVDAAVGPEPPRPEDMPLIQLIADLAAVALDNARSLDREQQRRLQIDAVRSVTAELTRELDLATLLDLILLRASEFVRCESAVVLLWDEANEALVPTAWRGLGDWIATTRLGLGDGAAGAAARLREGVVIEDYRRWDAAVDVRPGDVRPGDVRPGDVRPGDVRPGDVRPGDVGPTSVMAVPITYQERLIGVLTANRFGIGESFNRHDLEVLEVFGAQAAIAIENARLFEKATTAEALRELAQLKAELLNTVSHELRTPLSLIHGYSELLVHRAERLSPADVAQMSGEIHTSSKTLARLVDDLLDFSNLEHGRLQLRRQHLDLGEVLAAMVRSFKSQPGGERIAVEAGAHLAVDADPERLHQVVGNLLSNALAYTDDGPITVRARRDADRIRVDVVDRGPGLSAEEVDRIWESFYRGAGAAHLPNRGSGLGLTVVKQLVELHGGTVGVKSAPGQGSTFWFTLPAA